jgi:hypothetical protein
MNLLPEDIKLLEELCREYDINTSKILKLLKTVQDYEFKERRTGDYDTLREILLEKEGTHISE